MQDCWVDQDQQLTSQLIRWYWTDLETNKYKDFQVKKDTASVRVTFKGLTRTESISPTLTSRREKRICNLPSSSNQAPTHFVASVTYGGNCHFVFEKVFCTNIAKLMKSPRYIIINHSWIWSIRVNPWSLWLPLTLPRMGSKLPVLNQTQTCTQT